MPEPILAGGLLLSRKSTSLKSPPGGRPGVSIVPSANCRCSTLCSQLTAPVALSVTVAQLSQPTGLPSMV
jgi:hypothetical protein